VAITINVFRIIDCLVAAIRALNMIVCSDVGLALREVAEQRLFVAALMAGEDEIPSTGFAAGQGHGGNLRKRNNKILSYHGLSVTKRTEITPGRSPWSADTFRDARRHQDTRIQDIVTGRGARLSRPYPRSDRRATDRHSRNVGRLRQNTTFRSRILTTA